MNLPTTHEEAVAATEGYAERQRAIARNWDFYLGRQEAYLLQREGETSEEYARRPKIITNVTGLALDTKASYLYGVPVSRRLTSTVGDFAPRMDAVWQATRMRRFMGQVATEALVSGNAYICPRWYGRDQEVLWDESERLRYVLWPSDFVFPLLDESDRTLVRGYVYRYVFDASTGDRQAVDDMGMGTMYTRLRDIWGDKHEYVHLVTDERWFVWIDGVRQPQLELDGGINPYGRVPVVHVVNREIPHIAEGKSDVDDLVGLQSQINDRLSDVAEVVAYHAAPILQGRNVKAKTLTKGARRFFGFVEPPGQKAGFEYVTYDSAMPSAQLLLNHLFTEFSKVSRVPPTALGNLEELGNLTSGRALMVMYGPLLADIESKRVLYEEAEQQLVRATARVLGYHLHRDPTHYGEPDVQVRWRAGIVPQDPLEQTAVFQAQRSLNVVSTREMLRHLYPLLPDSRNAADEALWDEGPDSLDEVQAEIAAENVAAALTSALPQSNTVSGIAHGTGAKARSAHAMRTTQPTQDTPLLHDSVGVRVSEKG